MGEVVLEVCYLPDQENREEGFFRQLQEGSPPQALVSTLISAGGTAQQVTSNPGGF